MHPLWLALTAVAWLGAGACSPSGSASRPSTGAAADTTQAPASFVNRVWVVAESPQIAKGEIRIFLSDGTLVMTAPQARPAFGTWEVQDGALTITEGGQEYPVDVLELSAAGFRIRIRGPGEPIVIRFAPAEHTAVPLNPAGRP